MLVSKSGAIIEKKVTLVVKSQKIYKKLHIAMLRLNMPNFLKIDRLLVNANPKNNDVTRLKHTATRVVIITMKPLYN